LKIWRADWISLKLLILSSIPTISLTPSPNLRKLSRKEKSLPPNKINKRPLLSSKRSTIKITRAKRILPHRRPKVKLLSWKLRKIQTKRTHSPASMLKEQYMLSLSKNKEISIKKIKQN
jgi:hypothetical protein